MERAAATRQEAPSVIFDGQCPFCRAYVATLEDAKGSGQYRLNKIDARRSAHWVAQLATRGIDVNAGIVLIDGEGAYQGAEALSLLARQQANRLGLMSLPHRLLRHRRLSRLVYPLLRALRNSYLYLLGRQPIDNKQRVRKAASQQRH